ncbi:hypothetical protein [Streptomyces sp. NPDC001889]
MRVRVVRSHKIPSGTVTAEDTYTEEAEAAGLRQPIETVLGFNEDDLAPTVVDELSAGFTIEAQGWYEVVDPSLLAALPPAPQIRVIRRRDLPQGARVMIQDALDVVTIVFHEDEITEAGRLAYERFLIKRSKTWVRREGI